MKNYPSAFQMARMKYEGASHYDISAHLFGLRETPHDVNVCALEEVCERLMVGAALTEFFAGLRIDAAFERGYGERTECR